MTKHYYNEFNPESAAMLRQLMWDGLIPEGDVDERSITDIAPGDLRGYTQCHFFAGIGGWAFALQLAGWPEEREVWTGSCPCQPFSSAGKQKGKDDERHLWPVWLGLIRECRPATIFGEQVASAIAHGWLDDVYAGLEPQGYAIGAAVLPACSVGAPHKRDRLWFVAHAAERGRMQGNSLAGRVREEPRTIQERGRSTNRCGGVVADTESRGRGIWKSEDVRKAGGEVNTSSNNSSSGDGEARIGSMANTERSGQQGQGEFRKPLHTTADCYGEANRFDHVGTGRWQGGEWIACPDGKQRLAEPSIRLLVDGVQHHRPILHALGNAIVPQVAARFIEASM